MDLPSISNAPREIGVGGLTYRARALTLGQVGELLAWLEDRTGEDLAPLSSDAARLALATSEGLGVLLHLALSSCHPGLSRDEARALAGAMTPADEGRLWSIAFRRRPGYEPPKPAEAGDDAPAGKDLAEVAWGPMVHGLSGGRADRYGAVLGLTLDQVDCVCSKGEVEGPGTLSPAEVQAMWEAAPGPGAEAEAVDPAPVLLPGETIVVAATEEPTDG
jgi:hypothetical protein